MPERAPIPPEPDETPPEPPEEGEGEVIKLPPVSDEERDRIRQEAGEVPIVSHRISPGGMDYRPGSTTVSKGGKRRRGKKADADQA